MKSLGASLPLRIVIAACLIISGLVHLDLADLYSHAPTKVISESTAFRLQAITVLVLAAAALVILPRLRTLWLLIAVVSLGSLIALLIARYSSSTSFPGISPDGTWDVGQHYLGASEKVITAIVEAVATVLALVGFALPTHSTSASSRGIAAHA